ncbi:M24 family metallopeptidase [Rhizobium rhizogenes]|uniref:M24 family metallopeptidase n=1 Tax=Rhizobium rhizogenes TaxID=359 RepID=UPI00115D61F2|nr:Xaa-Pro peptidase family protein [Rhizobium rhizogenes]NTF65029.1 aminopeptidase P family protein [Rhizobium rhizogenes]NTG04032.1 aminopeptidase P family protein [Rhizobium rhizogenes]NTG11134.1 aminopeptidase P family protein [Rhizobium rhizogenes]NTG96377.1 aminopeptidase P family protein [Rhizobium rhizogenes]TRB24959.1 aminopeptidase P family protein [Rhizobium rhizogenes]
MSWQHPVPRITQDERQLRLSKLRQSIEAEGLSGVLLGPTESLRYFTGLVWHLSERFLGALVAPTKLYYIVPGFERSRVETLPHLPGDILVWQEEESSVALIARLVGGSGKLALDDDLPLFFYHALAAEIGVERLTDGGRLTRDLRRIKSPAEIALIQYAMDLTLDVHKQAHALMKPGIKASEVVDFIDRRHRDAGADGGSTFCIVSFATATSLPHGADGDQTLADGDVILVDTGCRLDGYHSDITRTYTLESGHKEFEQAWAIEREAQQAVFDAAKLGAACSSLDDAARAVLAKHSLGPDYRLPGLPHRAGHGLGLEIHEEPYIVRGNVTPLAAGMVFSNEPMIVFPEKFGIRLEDHIYMTEDGARWFTKPAKGPTEPFAD